MLNDLTVDQRRLADLMSDLSERCYYAGWLKNLEYVLWDACINGERSFGHDRITQQDIHQLMDYAQTYNCWIYNDKETEETAIDLQLWRDVFAKAVSDDPHIID